MEKHILSKKTFKALLSRFCKENEYEKLHNIQEYLSDSYYELYRTSIAFNDVQDIIELIKKMACIPTVRYKKLLMLLRMVIYEELKINLLTNKKYADDIFATCGIRLEDSNIEMVLESYIHAKYTTFTWFLLTNNAPFLSYKYSLQSLESYENELLEYCTFN